MSRELGTYVDDDTGNSYVVIERTRETRFRPLSGGRETRAGSKDYITSCGLHLNVHDAELNSFELVQTGGIIRRKKS